MIARSSRAPGASVFPGRARLKIRATSWALVACVLWCAPCGLSGAAVAGGVSSDSAATRLYSRACGHIARGHLELAYDRLAEAFGYGLKSPMQVLSDTCFVPLIEDSLWRRRVHDLMRRHAWDEEALLARSAAPKERARLVLRLSESEDKPVSGAVVDLSLHEDSCQGDGGSNPKQFACVRSRDSGRVTVETVWSRPKDQASGKVPGPHFHVSVLRDGFEVCRGTVELRENNLSGSGQDIASDSSAWVALEGPPELGRRAFYADIRLRRLP